LRKKKIFKILGKEKILENFYFQNEKNFTKKNIQREMYLQAK